MNEGQFLTASLWNEVTNPSQNKVKLPALHNRVDGEGM